MAGVTGLEPAASGVTGRRSNQLSYTPLRAASSSQRYSQACTGSDSASQGEAERGFSQRAAAGMLAGLTRAEATTLGIGIDGQASRSIGDTFDFVEEDVIGFAATTAWAVRAIASSDEMKAP